VEKKETIMPYIITQPCIGTKEASCVEVCPVDCIHPTPDEPGYTELHHLLPYDAPLIASGGWANRLQVPGAQQVKHIYNFVTLDDTKSIIQAMQEARTTLS
jgi:NAD-dependent dihydropyrimidine dehydrogenase PreA subunit